MTASNIVVDGPLTGHASAARITVKLSGFKVINRVLPPFFFGQNLPAKRRQRACGYPPGWAQIHGW